MAIDMTMSLGELVTTGTFIVSATLGVAAIRTSVSTLTAKVELTDRQNELRFTRVDAQIEDFKLEMKKLGEILIELTRADGRMNLMDDRMLAQGKRIDSMAEALRDMLIGKKERIPTV